MKNKIAFLSILIFGIIVTIGYVVTRRHVPQKATVTIGWVGPLTGPAALLGVDNLKAVQMALKEYEDTKGRGKPEIKLVVDDDQYIAKNSLESYRKLVSKEKIDILILSTYSGMFLVADRTLEDDVIVVNPIDNDAKLARLNRNVFLIAKQTKDLANVDAQAMINEGRKKAFILYFNGDEFIPTLASIVKDTFEAAGREVVSQEYPAGTTDFRAWLSDAKEKNADAYVFFGYVEIGFAMKQARDLGITTPFYSINTIVNLELQANSEGTIEGTKFGYFTHLDGNVKEAKAFLQRYEEKYDTSPDVEWTALQAYDTANIIIKALREAVKEDDFVEGMRTQILQTDNFKGVSGDLSIRADGTSRGIYPSLYTLKGGRGVKE